MHNNYLENNEFSKKLARIDAAFREHDEELRKISKDAFHSGFIEGMMSVFSFWPKERLSMKIKHERLDESFSRLSSMLAKELGTKGDGVSRAWKEVGNYLRTSMENVDVRGSESEGKFTKYVIREHDSERKDSSNVV